MEAQEKYAFNCKYLVFTDCLEHRNNLNEIPTDQNKDQHKERNKASFFS